MYDVHATAEAAFAACQEEDLRRQAEQEPAVKTRASVKVKAEKKEIVAEHASAMKTQASVRVKAEEKERTSAPQVPSKEEVIKALQKAYKEHESNQAALKSKLQKYCAVPEKWDFVCCQCERLVPEKVR